MRNDFFLIALLFFIFQCEYSNKNASKTSIISSENSTQLEEINLGRQLFFDKRLSINDEISCASCHIPRLAFTDFKRFSNGVGGRETKRNTPTILNSRILPKVMFDGHLPNLEQQVIVPIQEHVEMNMNMSNLIEKLKNIDDYQQLSKEIFNRDFDAWVLTRSISAFERSLVSDNSSFDKYYYKGDTNALTQSQKNGWELFSNKLYCTQCHPPPNFTTFEAINNGLYFDFTEDKGRFRIFHDSTDIGKFKVPSLRNIELTDPYMHDGSLNSLDEVINHYSKGGYLHFNKDRRIVPFKISKKEITDLKNFLMSLTDTTYMFDFR